MGKESSTLSNILDEYLACYINIFHPRFMLPETTIHFDLDSTPDHVLGYLHKRYQLVAEESKLVAAKSSNPIRALISKLVAANSLNPLRALISKLVAAKSLNPLRALISKRVDKKGSKNTNTTFHSIVELDLG
uniref:Uncharacterized protein n=1 Tax=Tanacetum cinerariifolium TaxID=118510 RepID=A0A699JDH4_TANCI|nr:hypothetical protein [Tanacetum cinerariifolium]